MRTAAPPPGDQHWEPGGQPVPRRSRPAAGPGFCPAVQKYRLRQDSADRQEVTLELFTKGRHRAESRFLHQTSFLDCGYARRVKGPDLLRGTGRNLIREHWSCQWSAGWRPPWWSAPSWGPLWRRPPASFCAGVSPARRRRRRAALLVQGFLMGIGDIADSMARQVDELLVTDGDFSSLRRLRRPQPLEAWQSQYDEAGSYDYPPCSGAASPGSCKCCPL